ncbi:CheR family methyltransferase [Magnetospira sp. QH-2]|uniref:CheR family methyltransferase n=1 Tax=Magnetospira sp. (strain QH-2) TaxID=1288970 RepID=UPI0003E819BF|nr:CheR family methyltransferase [Magnetospira sp. QH-2]CCQ73675.1 MCP methyltransferase/methylesterase, CheR/CheB with PAS/PAC sensor [Magnetospira sp. QH-2]
MPARKNGAPRKPGKTVTKSPRKEPTPSATNSDLSPANPMAFPVVGIGASAGGLEAAQAFFKGVAADSGAAYIFVQHLDPKRPTDLPELLARMTPMPVQAVTDHMLVEPNQVYVIPSNHELMIAKGHLELFELSEEPGLRHPIDVFFRSLAMERGEQAVAIILSGTASDGTSGLRDVKAEGGIVLVQDPLTAKFDGMPRSAIETKLADLILDPLDMGDKLVDIWAFQRPGTAASIMTDEAGIDEETLAKITTLVRNHTGHDFSDYKPRTLLRRIRRRMSVQQIEQPSDYVRHLQHNAAERTILFKELLIGVTRFFRDPEAFAVLIDKVIPALFDKRANDDELRVWVVGCSTGEEAYSIAILLQEEQRRRDANVSIQVFGTDIDGKAIETARGGLFSPSIAKDVPADLLRRYFTSENAGYRVKGAIRDMLVFAEQNVVKDPPFSRLDLVCCRNLLIYMGAALQRRVIPMYHYALKPEGYLFLGNSETIGEFTTHFQTVDRKAKIYRSTSAGTKQPRLLNISPPALADLVPVVAAEKPPKAPVNVRTWVESTLLSELSPACVVIDRHSQIVFIHGHTGRYLEPAPGEATTNILAMARPGLSVELATAVRKAINHGQEVLYEGLRVRTNGDEQPIDLLVRPITEPEALAGLILVVFKEVSPLPSMDPEQTVPESQQVVDELKRELRNTREYLQTSIEEMETSNEELKSTNEELQSSNEELQSINEEHVTSKEELQSVNEELATVNAELESKVSELTRSNNDMNNLLAATKVGTVFLDLHLCITRFTPSSADVIHLIDGDVGRPLAHTVSNLEYDELVNDARTVLDNLVPMDREVRSKDGKWYLIRILPYRTLDNVIEGVVLTFVDITRVRLLEAESRLAVVVQQASDAIVLQDLSGKILAWNNGAEKLYGCSEVLALEADFRLFVPPDGRADHDKLLSQLAKGKKPAPFEAQRLTQEGQVLRVSVSASLLFDESNKPWAVATTERERL